MCPMCDRVRLAEHGKQTRCVRCATVSDWRGTGKQGVRCDRVRLTGHGKQTSCVRYVTVSDWRGTGKQAVSDTRPFRLAGHGKTSCPMCDRVRLAGAQETSKPGPIRDRVRLAGHGRGGMAPTWPLPGDAGRFRDQRHDNYSTLGFSLLWPFPKQNRREKS